MQTVRKRELKRAMKLLHDEQMKLASGTGRGLRVAICILGEMRKKINHEQTEISGQATHPTGQSSEKGS